MNETIKNSGQSFITIDKDKLINWSNFLDGASDLTEKGLHKYLHRLLDRTQELRGITIRLGLKINVHTLELKKFKIDAKRINFSQLSQQVNRMEAKIDWIYSMFNKINNVNEMTKLSRFSKLQKILKGAEVLTVELGRALSKVSILAVIDVLNKVWTLLDDIREANKEDQLSNALGEKISTGIMALTIAILAILAGIAFSGVWAIVVTGVSMGFVITEIATGEDKWSKWIKDGFDFLLGWLFQMVLFPAIDQLFSFINDVGRSFREIPETIIRGIYNLCPDPTRARPF